MAHAGVWVVAMSAVPRKGADRLGEWRTVLVGAAGVAFITAGLFYDRWLPAFLITGLLTLGGAVALDGPAGSLPLPDDECAGRDEGPRPSVDRNGTEEPDPDG